MCSGVLWPFLARVSDATSLYSMKTLRRKHGNRGARRGEATRGGLERNGPDRRIRRAAGSEGGRTSRRGATGGDERVRRGGAGLLLAKSIVIAVCTSSVTIYKARLVLLRPLHLAGERLAHHSRHRQRRSRCQCQRLPTFLPRGLDAGWRGAEGRRGRPQATVRRHTQKAKG